MVLSYTYVNILSFARKIQCIAQILLETPRLVGENFSSSTSQILHFQGGTRKSILEFFFLSAHLRTSSVIRIAQKFGPHIEQKCAFFMLSFESVSS